MIGKGANEVRPATLSEVAKILERRQGTAGEFGFEQQTTLDYARKFGRLKVSEAQEMQSELEKTGLKNETAAKLVDMLPAPKAQLLLILSKDKSEIGEKKLGEIEEIVAKFSKKAKKIESKIADGAAPEGKKEAEAASEEKKGKKEEAAPAPSAEDDEGKKKAKKEKE